MMQQTTIFDFMHDEIKIGDDVQLDLSATDDMATNYFVEYYPQIIHVKGVVVKKQKLRNGNVSLLVDYPNDQHWLYLHEIKKAAQVIK